MAHAKSLIAAVALAVVLGSALAVAGCQPPTRVLFIGNSYTAVNGGIDRQLARLSPSVQALRIASGGYTLQRHWNEADALPTIRQGGWRYVVLQEQSQTPVTDPADFRAYVSQFNQEITRNGAQTILLMTWERPDSVSYGVTTENLAAAYQSVGADLGIKVAPAGLAFAQARRERPDIPLYGADGHPTIFGTYLAACVVYGTVFDRSPVGIDDSDSVISADVRVFLRRVAAQSLGY